MRDQTVETDLPLKTPESLGSKSPILDGIRDPADIRKLSRAELHKLCDELRADLVEAVSEIGGHFASSLGVVELSVAVHAAFDTPEDRVVWDVGHQGYIHKILTGRREALRSVRQFGGISGFLRREESEYDAFGAGHAGTSISAAAGMIEAGHHRYPGGRERRVVAVIGDGSMTCGMAFEALNHSGQLHRKLIVVLNDNEMSIAPNVGALSWAFSKTITGKISTSARRHFKGLVERGLIPHTFYRAMDKAEEAAQGFLSTPAMLFSAFGYRYIGPIDGHNLDQVIDALERAKKQDGPVLVHALTLKGKGYAPAEEDPVKYHGVTPFSIPCGTFKSTKKGPDEPAKSYTQIFGETLVELSKSDPRIVGITAAMPDGTGLKFLAKDLPDRFFDAGIAEQHAVTFAAGLACEGMRPVVAIYSTFLQRAYDQVIHDVCLQNLPVVFALDRGGLVGADGATHHGVFDLAYLRCIPNLVVMSPKDEAELRDMMFTAAHHETGPIAYRYPRGDARGVDISRKPQLIKIGSGEMVRTDNNPDVLFVALGPTVQTALEAAECLAADSQVRSSVMNTRFLKPFDSVLLTEVLRGTQPAGGCRLIVTIEDHVTTGGLGSAVLEALADLDLIRPPRTLRLGIDDTFVEHGSQAELCRLCGFDTQSVVKRVREVLPPAKSHSIDSPRPWTEKSVVNA